MIPPNKKKNPALMHELGQENLRKSHQRQKGIDALKTAKKVAKSSNKGIKILDSKGSVIRIINPN